MRRMWKKTDGTVVRGRLFTQKDLVFIRRMIREHPSWGRSRLSEEVCKKFNWRQDNGRLKDRGCRVALLKLESRGYLQLPEKKVNTGGRPPAIAFTEKISIPLMNQMPSDLQLKPVLSRADAKMWNSLIAQYHYLGLGTPVGRLLRYLVIGDNTVIGAISFSESAWNVKVRDDILVRYGMQQDEIRSNTIGNNRFLILPSVNVPNLASRTLGMSQRLAVEDWTNKYKKKPIFIETFVDPSRFHGTCYRAANWVHVGYTKGYAKRGASHENKKMPKFLFLKGTDKHSQKYLQNHSVPKIDTKGVSRVA